MGCESRTVPVYGESRSEQHRMELEAEGVEVRPDYTVDLEVYRWDPDPRDWGE